MVQDMNDYPLVLGLAALPALSNFIGGLLAEVLPVSQRTLGLALHVVIGVLLAVLSLELMPRAIAVQPVWVPILAFIAGGGFFILTHQGIEWLQHRRDRDRTQGNSQAWIIFLSLSIHLFSGGLMIGSSATIARNLSLLLALARVVAHLPQGFAAIAEFRQHKLPRRIRLRLSLSFFLPILVGASLGYWFLRGQSELWKLGVLAFTTGTLMTSVVEEIIPEAHENQDTPLSNLLFVVSFALFSWFSTYIK